MDNLPNELLVMIINYCNYDNRIISYQSTSCLFILRQIQVCTLENCGNADKPPWYHYNNLPYLIKLIKISCIEYSEHNLPSSLTHLVINSDCIIKKFPQTLINIVLRKNINIQFTELSQLTHLTLNDRYNEPFEKFPPKLKYLKFGLGFDQQINNLPQSITHLSLGREFDNMPNLPNELTHLVLDNFLFTDDEIFPLSLTHLTLKEGFSSNKFPETLTYLNIQGSCNFQIENLPPMLTHLIFGYRFNMPLENLPNSLRYLKLGRKFNNPIENLPDGLTHLILGNFYIRDIKNLPISLTHLFIGHTFMRRINFPLNLTHFSFESHSELHDIVPPTITHIKCSRKFYDNIKHLPLIYLILIKDAGKTSEIIDNFPETLTHLVFDNSYNHPVNNLPQSLKYIKFGEYFDQSIDNLPQLTHLILSRCFSHSIDKIPRSIIFIRIKGTYVIPKFIKKIILF